MNTTTKAAGGGVVVFIIFHLIAIFGVIFVGVDLSSLILFGILCFILMFFVTGFHHRFFSHRTFKPLGSKRRKEIIVGVMAFACATTVQKSALWWAYTHRHHHEHSDDELDVHSRLKFESKDRTWKGFFKGLWHSHVGWILSGENDTYSRDKLKDLLNPYPWLVWFDTLPGTLIPPILYGATMWLIGLIFGKPWEFLIWGFFAAVVTVWHLTFSINSFAHWIGKQRYNTGDESRNSFILALFTHGEGWHNNHHHGNNQHRTAQGEKWYEIDVTYYILCIFEKLGLIKCNR